MLCFTIGYIPQYYEIYIHKQVIGISILFLCIDMCGAILSIISLLLQYHINPVVCACYIVVFICDLLIVILHYILKPSPVNINTTNNNTELTCVVIDI